MKNKSNILMVLSVVSVVLSAAVSILGMELWLAGTQWMLVAIVLAIYGLYTKKA